MHYLDLIIVLGDRLLWDMHHETREIPSSEFRTSAVDARLVVFDSISVVRRGWGMGLSSANNQFFVPSILGSDSSMNHLNICTDNDVGQLIKIPLLDLTLFFSIINLNRWGRKKGSFSSHETSPTCPRSPSPLYSRFQSRVTLKSRNYLGTG